MGIVRVVMKDEAMAVKMVGSRVALTVVLMDASMAVLMGGPSVAAWVALKAR